MNDVFLLGTAVSTTGNVQCILARTVLSRYIVALSHNNQNRSKITHMHCVTAKKMGCVLKSYKNP